MMKVREKYQATKDQLDKVTLLALVQSISDHVRNSRLKETPKGDEPEDLMGIRAIFLSNCLT